MVWHRNECINLLIIRKICTCVCEGEFEKCKGNRILSLIYALCVDPSEIQRAGSCVRK